MRTPEPLVYTVDELMQVAKVGRTLIYKEIKAGRLRVAKMARRTLIPVSEAERWITASMPALEE